MDLYRLRGASDLHVLDIPKVLETSVCLIEWPDRLGELQPVNRLGEQNVTFPTTDHYSYDTELHFSHSLFHCSVVLYALRIIL